MMISRRCTVWVSCSGILAEQRPWSRTDSCWFKSQWVPGFPSFMSLFVGWWTQHHDCFVRQKSGCACGLVLTVAGSNPSGYLAFPLSCPCSLGGGRRIMTVLSDRKVDVVVELYWQLLVQIPVGNWLSLFRVPVLWVVDAASWLFCQTEKWGHFVKQAMLGYMYLQGSHWKWKWPKATQAETFCGNTTSFQAWLLLWWCSFVPAHVLLKDRTG